MNKVENLLRSKTDDINYMELLSLKEEYWELLNSNKFPIAPEKSDAVTMIQYFKRKDHDNPQKIGAYKNITVFEAANRIASDLVIIEGVIQLIDNNIEPKNSIVTLCLGTKHIKGQGDFTINGKVGEAFNVAPSFFKAKLQQTINKWKENNLTYILVNKEVTENFNFSKLDIDRKIKLIAVENWQNTEG